MEELLYIYEKYGMALLGIAVMVLLALQCIQFLRVHRLKKQLRQMTERQQLKDDMARAAQSGYGRRMNDIDPSGNGKGINDAGRHDYSRSKQRTGWPDYAIGQSTDIGKEDRGVRNEAWDNDSPGRMEQAETEQLAQEESQLISAVLGEIFP